MKPPDRPRVLVVDDQLEMARTLADSLTDRGYEALALSSGREAIARLEKQDVDAVVTDLRMPSIDGLEVLAAARKDGAERPVIVMTAYSAIDTAIESIRRGAYHYLTKPFKTDELVLFLARALEERRIRHEARALRSALRDQYSSAQIVSVSLAMKRVLEVIRKVAGSELPVLITGETGTGKGLVARALHLDSPRASGAFVTVNCAALPEALLESELFGHVKGAFTGAVSNRTGLFAEANGGSLFLDEIGDMPLAMQAKLLHALERGAIRRVGAEKEQTLDVRILAATNRDLRKAVRAGSFREDLLYRLDAIPIEVRALRHRTEDIPVLLEHFLRLARARQPGAKLERIGPSAGEALREYPWPGNVRELMHLVERLVALTHHAELGLDDLPQNVRTRPADAGPQFSGDIITIRTLERRYAEWALDQMAGQKGKTASRLGIDEKTLWRWLNERGPDDE